MTGASYERILFATDFSESAAHALEWATTFARKCGGKLDIIHVLTPMAGDPATAEKKLPECVSEEDVDLVASRRVVRAISEELGILHAAREDASDLIVIGTRGMTGLKHVFMGSTAQHVVQLASCPVLTVRDSDHAIEHP